MIRQLRGPGEGSVRSDFGPANLLKIAVAHKQWRYVITFYALYSQLSTVERTRNETISVVAGQLINDLGAPAAEVIDLLWTNNQ